MFECFSLICAMRCDEAGGCTIFRIDSGLCTFGFIMAPAPEYEESEGSEIEVYIKSIFHTFINWPRLQHLCLDGKLDIIGCFVYSNNHPQSSRILDDKFLTVDFCLDHCMAVGKKFSILDNGSYCSCSNTLPPLKDIVSNSQCSAACSGEPGTEGKCGGYFRWSFHAVKF